MFHPYPSSDLSTTPILDPREFDVPSTNILHGQGEICCTLEAFILSVENLATKSATFGPLIDVLGLYLMSKAFRVVPCLVILS